MPSLRDVQRAFVAALASDDSVGVNELVHDDGIAPAQRLQIYRNNHRAVALTALAAAYPIVERLGGNEWFAQSVVRYQTQFPSRNGDQQFLGDRFAQFLAQEFDTTDYAYFADVARLEWAYQEVLTAADSPSLGPAALTAFAGTDYGRLVFVPRAALRLVESRFPILAIWKTNQKSFDQPPRTVRLDDGPSRVLVIRRADHVELRELTASSFVLLQQFCRGASFGVAASAVPAADLAPALKNLIALETLASVSLNNPA